MSPPRKLWNGTAAQLAAAIQNAGSRRALGRELGVTADTITKWCRETGVDTSHAITLTPPLAAEPTGPDDAWLLSILDKHSAASVDELADHADVAPRRVREALERLATAGYRIANDGPSVILEKVRPAPSDQLHPSGLGLFAGDRVRFGIASDTHLGSKECHLDELHAAYDVFEAEGITTVYHPGDIVAGLGVYRHQHRDLAPYAHTFDEQVAYAAREFPMRAGITTKLIGGNHDLEGDLGRLGVNAALAVANQRVDIDYCGEYSAYYELPNGGHLHVLHPMGGLSYAMSYKPQKHAESYPGGKKPAMAVFGHWHRTGGPFWARNIALLLAGTFEGSTSLAIRCGMGEPGLGFWIIDATLADDGSLVRCTSTWFPVYAGRSLAA